MRRCMVCLIRFYWGVHIGVVDEWGVCGMYEEVKKFIQGFGGET
jgi:hypothetical protein